MGGCCDFAETLRRIQSKEGLFIYFVTEFGRIGIASSVFRIDRRVLSTPTMQNTRTTRLESKAYHCGSGTSLFTLIYNLSFPTGYNAVTVCGEGTLTFHVSLLPGQYGASLDSQTTELFLGRTDYYILHTVSFHVGTSRWRLGSALIPSCFLDQHNLMPFLSVGFQGTCDDVDKLWSI